MSIFPTRRSWRALVAAIICTMLFLAACASKNATTGAGAGMAEPAARRRSGKPAGLRGQCRRSCLLPGGPVRPDRAVAGARSASQAQWLQAYPRYTVTIEGHADERGTREYNIALGARRAQAVRDYLISQGIAAGRMRTISYGKERPVAICNDASCWSQNRRAVTVLNGAAGIVTASR